MAAAEEEKTGVDRTEYYPNLYWMISQRVGITIEQLHCIGNEGEEYWWPLPPEYEP